LPRRYKLYDVFADRPLAGNPLAVVLDTKGLDSAAMQRIAREFNLSETVFLLPPENPAHTARARIFTPVAEIAFAGHPTVGAAVCLAGERLKNPATPDAVIVLEESVGPVRCGVKLGHGGGFAEFDCPKLPERFASAPSKDACAMALGLAKAEIGFENHVPSAWTCGNPFYYVPVKNMAALSKAAANRIAWREAFGEMGAAFLYTRETEGHGHSFRARMFAPTFGIEEDPATGSAVAALAGAVHEFDAPPAGLHAAIVEQGFEMGRPSLIRLEMTVTAHALSNVRIGGDAVEFASGTLAV
jgi:trans-2,3-dihydro-3-hydroxyanthranilate isomerase